MEGARKIPPLQVRCPQELHQWLKAQAELNHRSLNSEIVARLELSKQFLFTPPRPN
jgi:predicted HicB family RNase H-like nuclease